MNKKLQKLVKFNKVMAGLHFLQATTIVLISSKFAVDVSTSYQVFDETTKTLNPQTKVLFDVKLAYLIAAFLFISAIAHLYISFIAPKKYTSNLLKGINKTRWIEYSISASLMMVAISLLTGIEDLSTLIMIFVLTAIMNLMGLVMEVHNQTTKKTNWLSYNIGVLAGIIPWLIIGIYFWGGSSFGDSSPPTFVYWIYVSIFAFFNIFAINMILQYKKVGPWKDYLYGERVYIILSLVAKSLLAWQVYAGTLRPV